MPPTDTDALRADCSSVVRYRGRSREHGLRFTHEIATRRQVQTVVFVRHVDGLGRYDSASAHETVTTVVFVSRVKELDNYTSRSSDESGTDSDPARRRVDFVELCARCVVAALLVVE